MGKDKHFFDLFWLGPYLASMPGGTPHAGAVVALGGAACPVGPDVEDGQLERPIECLGDPRNHARHGAQVELLGAKALEFSEFSPVRARHLPLSSHSSPAALA